MVLRVIREFPSVREVWIVYLQKQVAPFVVRKIMRIDRGLQNQFFTTKPIQVIKSALT